MPDRKTRLAAWLAKNYVSNVVGILCRMCVLMYKMYVHNNDVQSVDSCEQKNEMLCACLSSYRIGLFLFLFALCEIGCKDTYK